MPRRSKIALLPKDVREELDRRLVDGAFSGYRQLSRWLGTKGCQIIHGAVAQYGKRLERRIDALRIATAQAREIVDASGGDDHVMDDALTRLVQQQLFSILVDLDTKNPQELNLPTLARSVAQVGRISLAQQRRAEELEAKVREKVAAAEQKVLTAARGLEDSVQAPAEGGLSPEAEERIRKALLEITQ